MKYNVERVPVDFIVDEVNKDLGYPDDIAISITKIANDINTVLCEEELDFDNSVIFDMARLFYYRKDSFISILDSISKS